MDDQRLIIALGAVLHGMGWPCLPLPHAPQATPSPALPAALPSPAPAPPAAPAPAPQGKPPQGKPLGHPLPRNHPFYSCPHKERCEGGPDCICLEAQIKFIEEHARDIHGNFVYRKP